jgi:hypothetical protein
MWMRGSERRFLQELDGTTGVPQVWSKPPHFCGWVWPQDDIYGCLVPLGSPKSVGQSSCSLSSLSSNCREYMSFFVKCPMARDCHASFAYRLNHGAVSHALSTYWEVSCEKSQPNQPQDMLCRTRGEALLNALHCRRITWQSQMGPSGYAEKPIFTQCGEEWIAFLQQTMENHHAINGQIHYKSPFSIAM